MILNERLLEPFVLATPKPDGTMRHDVNVDGYLAAAGLPVNDRTRKEFMKAYEDLNESRRPAGVTTTPTYQVVDHVLLDRTSLDEYQQLVASKLTPLDGGIKSQRSRAALKLGKASGGFLAMSGDNDYCSPGKWKEEDLKRQLGGLLFWVAAVAATHSLSLQECMEANSKLIS